jgi:hypothetical protein
MKLRAPKGCGALSHRGRAVEIAKDGSIEVDDGAWGALATHGFTRWDEKPTEKSADAPCDRSSHLAMILAKKAMPAIDGESNCAHLVAVEPSAISLGPENDAELIATADVQFDAIATLNRQALFSFLRAKGVSIALPITNEQLRAAARRALDG